MKHFSKVFRRHDLRAVLAERQRMHKSVRAIIDQVRRGAAVIVIDQVHFQVEITAKDGRKTIATYAQVLNPGWVDRIRSWLEAKR